MGNIVPDRFFWALPAAEDDGTELLPAADDGGGDDGSNKLGGRRVH